jgi:hypothetical protein
MDPTCDLNRFIQHQLREFILDPSCNMLSASRLMFVLINLFGGLAAWVLVVCGFYFNMSQAFSPAAVIFTGLAASDATVYFGSTRKEYNRSNGEQ